jgi:hypothetical protein
MIGWSSAEAYSRSTHITVMAYAGVYILSNSYTYSADSEFPKNESTNISASV